MNLPMGLKCDNILDSTSESPKQVLLEKECSYLMIKIHEILDLRNAPIKNMVERLGVTPAQARNLAKGDINKFSVYELQTFLQRLSPDIK